MGPRLVDVFILYFKTYAGLAFPLSHFLLCVGFDRRSRLWPPTGAENEKK